MIIKEDASPLGCGDPFSIFCGDPFLPEGRGGSGQPRGLLAGFPSAGWTPPPRRVTFSFSDPTQTPGVGLPLSPGEESPGQEVLADEVLQSVEVAGEEVELALVAL